MAQVSFDELYTKAKQIILTLRQQLSALESGRDTSVAIQVRPGAPLFFSRAREKLQRR